MTAMAPNVAPGKPVRFTPSELQRRRRAVLGEVTRRNCSGFVSFSAATIQWLTQYAFVPNERPFAVYLSGDGVLTLFVPLLKAHHAAVDAFADVVEPYPEYPDEVHPMRRLRDLIAQRRPRALMLESPGYSSPHGYYGPSLLDLLHDVDCQVDQRAIARLRMIKSEEEIAILRHACDWAISAHRLLQDAVASGRRESAVAGAATGGAMSAMLDRFGGDPSVVRPMRVSAGFGGQIGPNGTAHHAPNVLDPVLQKGDLLISQVHAMVAGYYADIERTMIVGKSSAAVRDLFSRGVEIQACALDLIAPGVACADIDRAVKQRYCDTGILDMWRHHVGHSVGVLVREAPYLDQGDPTVLEPGMIVTVEPGLYRDGVGGFRHSDCVLLTENGAEILTDYPRDFDSLCCA